MTLIADILMIAGALGAAFYCIVLSRRLSRFSNLETGMGGAIAALSSQVTDMNVSLEKARKAAGDSSATLDEITGKAEAAAKRLELLLASMQERDAETPPAKAEADEGPVFVRTSRAADGEGARQ